MLNGLRLDRSTLLAALLYPALAHKLYTPEELLARFGAEFAELAGQLAKLAPLAFNPDAKQEQQVQSFRKNGAGPWPATSASSFLWLAARLVRLRALENAPSQDPTTARLARETLDIYTPLGRTSGYQHHQNGAGESLLQDSASRGLPPDLRAF